MMTIAPVPLLAELAGIQMAVLTASAGGLLALLWYLRTIGRGLGALLVLAVVGNVIPIFSGSADPVAQEIGIEQAAG